VARAKTRWLQWKAGACCFEVICRIPRCGGFDPLKQFPRVIHGKRQPQGRIAMGFPQLGVHRLALTMWSVTLTHAIHYPEGIAAYSPGLRLFRYPGNDGASHFNPNGVASGYVQAEKRFEW
jgi:hypothetical protein